MFSKILLPKSVQSRLAPLEWSLQRTSFFLRQRLFYALSALLLNNRRCGRLRAALLRHNGATVGWDCWLYGGLTIQESFHFTLGDRVFLNAGCLLDGSAPITIGSYVSVGYQVTFITGSHQIGPHNRRAGPLTPAPITVGDGAWIGARAIILPGVTIGAGAVVAAGAVVTRDVPPDMLVAGCPARIIRALDPASGPLPPR